MSLLHVIRLRGPWEFAVLARFAGPDAAPPKGRMNMPTDWAATLGEAFRGRVEFRRRFGRPTGLTSAEEIWLVCDGVESWATLSLNGEPLGAVEGIGSSTEFEVTTRLGDRNELVVVVECPRIKPEGTFGECGSQSDRSGGLTGEVRLEIRTAETA
jgi:hypothetical protein